MFGRVGMGASFFLSLMFFFAPGRVQDTLVMVRK